MYAILYIILIMDIDILIDLYNSFLGIVLSDAAMHNCQSFDSMYSWSSWSWQLG